jgi:hypothetical protein
VLWQTQLGAPLRKQFASKSWTAATTESFYHYLDPLNLSMLVPPNRRELFAAEFDHFIPLEYTNKLQRAWQHPHLRLYSTGHIGLLWSRKFLRDVRQIVSQQLKLGRWQEMPITVVTEDTLETLPMNISFHASMSQSVPQPVAGK